MAVKKTKVTRDGGKSTKCFCIIGLVVFLLLVLVATAVDSKTLKEASTGTNFTENEATNEVKPHGVMLNILYSIVKVVHNNYIEIACVGVVILLLVLYLYNFVCMVPQRTGRNNYGRGIDV